MTRSKVSSLINMNFYGSVKAAQALYSVAYRPTFAFSKYAIYLEESDQEDSDSDIDLSSAAYNGRLNEVGTLNKYEDVFDLGNTFMGRLIYEEEIIYTLDLSASLHLLFDLDSNNSTNLYNLGKLMDTKHSGFNKKLSKGESYNTGKFDYEPVYNLSTLFSLEHFNYDDIYDVSTLFEDFNKDCFNYDNVYELSRLFSLDYLNYDNVYDLSNIFSLDYLNYDNVYDLSNIFSLDYLNYDNVYDLSNIFSLDYLNYDNVYDLSNIFSLDYLNYDEVYDISILFADTKKFSVCSKTHKTTKFDYNNIHDISDLIKSGHFNYNKLYKILFLSKNKNKSPFLPEMEDFLRELFVRELFKRHRSP